MNVRHSPGFKVTRAGRRAMRRGAATPEQSLLLEITAKARGAAGVNVDRLYDEIIAKFSGDASAALEAFRAGNIGVEEFKPS